MIDAVERARELRFEERLDEALAVLLECAEQHNDETLAVEIAAVYTERGRAQEDLQRALHDFGEARSWHAMPTTVAAEAAAYYRAGDRTQARERVEAALEADPEDPEANAVLARLMIDAGEYAKIQEVLVLLPAEFAGDVYLYMGEVLRRQGRVDEAVQCLAGLRQVCGGNPEVHVGLARCHEDRGEAAEAMRCWRAATELDPGRIEAWRGMALAAARKGEELDMVRAIDRAAQLDRADTLAWLERVRGEVPLLERVVV